MSFTVVAIIYPKAGKTDRVQELLGDVVKHTESNEPGVLRYQVHREVKASKEGTEDIVMIETYKNKQVFQEHGSSPKFKAFQKALGKEELLRAPMTLKLVNEKLGFASRL